MIKQATQPP